MPAQAPPARQLVLSCLDHGLVYRRCPTDRMAGRRQYLGQAYHSCVNPVHYVALSEAGRPPHDLPLLGARNNGQSARYLGLVGVTSAKTTWSPSGNSRCQRHV